MEVEFMSGMVSFIIKNKFNGIQCKILLYMAYAKNHNPTIKDLSIKLGETQKDIVDSLKSFKSTDSLVEINDSNEIEIKFKNRSTVFKIKNDTRYKVFKKEDLIKEQALEIGEFWKSVCNKPRSEIKDKRLKVLKNAIEKYGYEKAKKSILGCSKTLWNMGYNDYGDKLNQRYVDLSLIFRNEEYVERFIENSELPNLDEQLDEINKKSKSIKTTKVEAAGERRNEWLEDRLKMFNNDDDVKKISSGVK
jgi:hypothetical protein